MFQTPFVRAYANTLAVHGFLTERPLRVTQGLKSEPPSLCPARQGTHPVQLALSLLGRRSGHFYEFRGFFAALGSTLAGTHH